MKKLNVLSLGLAVTLLIFLSIQLYLVTTKPNFDNFSFKGEVSVCEKNCFNLSVKNVYTGSYIEVSSDDVYGGGSSPQVCDNISDSQCSELDITKLSEYKMVSRMIGGNRKSFPNFQYLNRFVESPTNRKIYFLYRMLSEDGRTGWVYDDPLAIISFDVDTRMVSFEGQLNVTGINVQNMYISPKGNYVVITDGFNPQYLPPNTTSGITIFNLRDRTVKSFAVVVDGGSLDFITWIDDNHFFYSENAYNSGRKKIFKIGTI